MMRLTDRIAIEASRGLENSCRSWISRCTNQLSHYTYVFTQHVLK